MADSGGAIALASSGWLSCWDGDADIYVVEVGFFVVFANR